MPNRILNMLVLLWALPASGATPAAAVAQPRAPAFALQVKRVEDAGGGKVYQISSSATVAAAPATVWRTLTDYDRLAEFVPDLDSARVVSRNGDKVVVEQLGKASFLFFSQPIRLVVQVHEQAPGRIDIGLVEGNMKVYRASWELTPLPDAAGTKVVYKAAIEPAFYVPPMVGTALVRKDIARMMGAVLSRMERQE